MANHDLRASIVYRRSRIRFPEARALMREFEISPRGSVRALLNRAGPFQASPDSIRRNPRDAFLFTNQGWSMTEDDARVLREHFQHQVDAVKLIGIEFLRNALGGLGVSVPVLGTVGLPGLVIDEVIRRVTGDLTDRLVDSIISGTPGNFGRCGGMAFAGLDYFRFGQDVPEMMQQPASGPLRGYIFSRLLDSLDLNADRFVEWTMQLHIMPVISTLASGALGLVAGELIGGPVGAAVGALVAGGKDVLGLGGPKELAHRTRQELGHIRERLDAGPAWPIGLIYDDSAFVWDQHQILALRYQDLGDGRLLLIVWDNNDGRRETTWIVDARGNEVQIVGGDPRDGHIKGILRGSYSPSRPPPSP
jgi:hypothetical protein